MKNNYLPILWDYPDMSLKSQTKIDKFFEDKKHYAMLGDSYSAYAAYVIDIECYFIRCIRFYICTDEGRRTRVSFI